MPFVQLATRFLAVATALLAITCSTRAFAEEDLMDDLRDGTIGNDYFVGEWCLVASTRDGDPAEPNLLFKFLNGGPLNYQAAATGDKLHYGSWKLTSNMMMLRTSAAFGAAGIESITQDEFTVAGKFGYTFRRGACE